MNGHRARALRRQAESMTVAPDARGRVDRWAARQYAGTSAARHAWRAAVAGAARATYRGLKRRHRIVTRSGR